MISCRGTAASIVLFLGSVSTLVHAQGRIQFAEYSAKFLCGVVEGKESAGAPVGPGTYETSINIHNPQILPSASVTFLKKTVVAPREGQEPSAPSRFRRDILKSDFAEHVDCKVIRSLLGPAAGGAFVEGFVVLIVVPTKGITPTELDVVGVYTVSNPQGQDTDLEMLPVTPRIETFPLAEGTKLRDQMIEGAQKE
jgi:hypothetical protein